MVDCISKYAELMQWRTSDAANSALGVITDALAISCYSERLLEMKAEALFPVCPISCLSGYLSHFKFYIVMPFKL